MVPLPSVKVAHVHVLNEPDDMPGTLEVTSQVNNALLVNSLLHHRVDFDWSQSNFGGLLDAFQHPLGAESAPVHLLENVIVQGV